MCLKNKTIVITGATRGIGRAMALKFGKSHANIVILGKTHIPHKKLEGTIHSVAKEVTKLGGQALPIHCDLRDVDAFEGIVNKIITTYGSIHALVNNASALHLSPMGKTSPKKYDLIQSVLFFRHIFLYR